MGYAVMQHTERPPYAVVEGIRLFATRAQAEKCRGAFGPVVEVITSQHWYGKLPRHGARFTKEDQSYPQLMGAIMSEE